MTDADHVPGADGHLATVRALVGPHLLVLPGVASAVVDAQDRVLLMRHVDSDTWVLPGGAVEPYEQPAAAVVRETREETGLEVRPVAIIAVDGGHPHFKRYRNGDEVSYVTTVFRCEPVGGELRRDGHEALDLRWVPRARIAELADLAPWLSRLLPHLTSDVARFEHP